MPKYRSLLTVTQKRRENRQAGFSRGKSPLLCSSLNEVRAKRVPPLRKEGRNQLHNESGGRRGEGRIDEIMRRPYSPEMDGASPFDLHPSWMMAGREYCGWGKVST